MSWLPTGPQQRSSGSQELCPQARARSLRVWRNAGMGKSETWRAQPGAHPHVILTIASVVELAQIWGQGGDAPVAHSTPPQSTRNMRPAADNDPHAPLPGRAGDQRRSSPRPQIEPNCTHTALQMHSHHLYLAFSPSAVPGDVARRRRTLCPAAGARQPSGRLSSHALTARTPARPQAPHKIPIGAGAR